MKKILCLVSAIALTITSCSSNDNDSNDGNSQTLLPKKIVETTVENGSSGSLTYSLTYDGNKLKDIALSDASRFVYTYTGDLITKIEEFRSSILYATNVYAYENGKLISKITTKAYGNAPQEKLTYVYNANGTVNENQSDIIDKQEVKYDTTTLYTFGNGNLVSEELIDGVLIEKITSTFDDKNSPFINILGVKLLLDFDSHFDFYSKNNAVKSVTVDYNSSGAVTQTATVTTTNKYNADGFITEIFSGDSKNSEKFEITY